MGTRLQTLSDIHKHDLAALERALIKRVETAERLCNLVLFEQERAKRQIRALCQEVAELREEVGNNNNGGSSSNGSNGGSGIRSVDKEGSGDGKTTSAAGWVDLDDDDNDAGYDV